MLTIPSVVNKRSVDVNNSRPFHECLVNKTDYSFDSDRVFFGDVSVIGSCKLWFNDNQNAVDTGDIANRIELRNVSLSNISEIDGVVWLNGILLTYTS